MEKNDERAFKLTPAYSLLNQIVVLEQHGADIVFMIQKNTSEILKTKIEKAFFEYLKKMCLRYDCPDNFFHKPHVCFIEGSDEQIRKNIHNMINEQYFNDENNFEISDTENTLKNTFFSKLLNQAIEKKASCVHIQKDNICFRIDGKLSVQYELSVEEISQLIFFIKHETKIDLPQKQEGHIIFTQDNDRTFYVTVSKAQSFDKEFILYDSLVLHINEYCNKNHKSSSNHFTQNQKKIIKKLICEKSGLILVAGSKNSKKTETIEFMFKEILLNSKEKKKIISLSDLQEIKEKKNNKTFLSISNQRLKKQFSSIINQDADIINIGNICDEATARFAIQMSLSNCLVFGTMDTSSIANTIRMMENLGISNDLLCSQLLGIIYQMPEITEEKEFLCIDVLIPSKKIQEKINLSFTDLQIEQLFEHNTNFSQLFEETLQTMNRKYEQDKKQNDLFKSNSMFHRIFIPNKGRISKSS